MPKGTWWLKGEKERERERGGLASVDFQIILSVALWPLDYLLWGLFVVVVVDMLYICFDEVFLSSNEFIISLVQKSCCVSSASSSSSLALALALASQVVQAATFAGMCRSGTNLIPGASY